MLPTKNSAEASTMSPSPMNTIAAQLVTPMTMKMASSRFLMPL